MAPTRYPVSIPRTLNAHHVSIRFVLSDIRPDVGPLALLIHCVSFIRSNEEVSSVRFYFVDRRKERLLIGSACP